MSMPIRSGWSSRPIAPGEYDLDELVTEEILDADGTPVAFVINAGHSDVVPYVEEVRSLIIDAAGMLDLLASVHATASDDGTEGGPLARDITAMLKKHGRL